MVPGNLRRISLPISVVSEGDGNVVTDVSRTGNVVTVTKGLRAMATQAVGMAEMEVMIEEGTADPQTWYCVYSDAEPYPLMRVYIGDTLLAERTSGSAGFPYTFPMSF